MLVLEITNISQSINVADYRYTVKVSGRVIKSGIITGHSRLDGWEKLVSRVADDCRIVSESKQGALF